MRSVHDHIQGPTNGACATFPTDRSRPQLDDPARDLLARLVSVYRWTIARISDDHDPPEDHRLASDDRAIARSRVVELSQTASRCFMPTDAFPRARGLETAVTPPPGQTLQRPYHAGPFPHDVSRALHDGELPLVRGRR